jgi:hypothetical protein
MQRCWQKLGKYSRIRVQQSVLTRCSVPTDVNLFIGLPHGFRSYEEKLSASARWDKVIEDGICWALSDPPSSYEFHVKT